MQNTKIKHLTSYLMGLYDEAPSHSSCYFWLNPVSSERGNALLRSYQRLHLILLRSNSFTD